MQGCRGAARLHDALQRQRRTAMLWSLGPTSCSMSILKSLHKPSPRRWPDTAARARTNEEARLPKASALHSESAWNKGRHQPLPTEQQVLKLASSLVGSHTPTIKLHSVDEALCCPQVIHGTYLN